MLCRSTQALDRAVFLVLLLQACASEDVQDPELDEDQASTESADPVMKADPTICVLGRVVECPCDNKTNGTQTCVDKGRHYTACKCDTNVPSPPPVVVDAGVDDEELPPGEGATTYIVQGEQSRGFAATGVLLGPNGPFCTGTLVNYDLVLTAAHCTEVCDRQTGACIPLSPHDIRFAIGADVTSPAVAANVLDYEVSPRYARDADKPVAGDLAILRLESQILDTLPVDLDFRPVEERVGETAVLVGYGASYGIGQLDLGAGLRRQATVVVAGATAESFWYEFATTQMGACRGDSGGPAFVMNGDRWVQVGVTSWGDRDCTRYGVYQRLDVHRDWLIAKGVPETPRAPQCIGDNVCDGLCPSDDDCYDLLCDAATCPAPSDRCVNDGVCDEFCGVVDPDCVTSTGDDPCSQAGLYGNGSCDPHCHDDPDCRDTSSQCIPTSTQAVGSECRYFDEQGQLCGSSPLTRVAVDTSRRTCVYLDALGRACAETPAVAVCDPLQGLCVVSDAYQQCGRTLAMFYPDGSCICY